VNGSDAFLSALLMAFLFTCSQSEEKALVLFGAAEALK
jgi:hypothetical protein